MRQYAGPPEIPGTDMQQYLAQLCLTSHKCSRICYCWELRKVPGIAAEILRAKPNSLQIPS